MRKLGRSYIVDIFLLTIFSLSFAYGQNTGQPTNSNEPVVVPLTDEEKKLNPKSIVENQPDFTAVQEYFSARDISGFSGANKVARKGNKYRTDTGYVVVISELNKSSIRLNTDKTYEEVVGIRKPLVSATIPLIPTDLLGFSDISFAALGTIQIDNNKLLKIQAKSKEFDQEIFLYADLSKKNLFTIIQILSPKRSSIQRLNNISFEVADTLFDISSYRPLPKYQWNKIETATVFFRKDLTKEALVFRHKNYIFIHIAEFDHFFIDLDKKIADTVVFQGLLVAKDGSYIWRTNEKEAISVGEPSNIIKKDCDSCVKIKSDSSSIILLDPDNKAKVLLKIKW